MFDETRKIGGLRYDPTADMTSQVTHLADVLSKKLEEERGLETIAEENTY